MTTSSSEFGGLRGHVSRLKNAAPGERFAYCEVEAQVVHPEKRYLNSKITIPEKFASALKQNLIDFRMLDV